MLPERRTVAIGEERVVAPPERAQGDTLHSDRLGYWGTGQTRSRDRWRLLDATDPQGQRRTSVSSWLDEPAERLTP